MSSEETENFSLDSAPTVFISYSHDSREHKQWVAQLATSLRLKHVQVILDQWDLEAGDDIPKFMEGALKSSDRVLMICSEAYVRKANDGKGGAGYEAMIVTAELVQDLGTNKFIPIIRQNASQPPIQPTCIISRKHINFSNDAEFDVSLYELAMALHQVTKFTKPPLGPYPFAALRSPTTETRDLQNSAKADFQDSIRDPSIAFKVAGNIAASGDTKTWRKLLRTLLNHGMDELIAWRAADGTIPNSTERDTSSLFQHASKGVSFYLPLIACLVAGADSGKSEFSGQLGWIDEIYFPSKWNRSGTTYWGDFPELIFFVTQALVGAMLMQSQSSKEVYELASTRIAQRYGSNEAEALFLQPSITGWPQSMHQRSTTAWSFLDSILDKQEWVNEAFGSTDYARASISAYYQMLSFLNFCHSSANERLENLERGDGGHFVTVPLCFCRASTEIKKGGYQGFLAHRKLIQDLLAANNLGDPEKLEKDWLSWMKIAFQWLSNVYGIDGRFIEVIQKSLPKDLRNKGFSLKEP